ncbi:MAG: hypothetical protein ACLTLQ_19640 [[Clostridium] scindens]
MNTTEIRPAKSDSEIQDIAILAEEIWHQHFTPIIGKEQVDYMVDKFQSYPAIKAQIEHDGYEYFRSIVRMPWQAIPAFTRKRTRFS